MKLIAKLALDWKKIEAIALKTRAEVQVELKALEFPENLCGACAIANYRLWLRLRAFGAKLMASDEHIFLMLDKYVVDITATQYLVFSKYPVLIMPFEEIKALGPRTSYPYRNAKEIPSVSAAELFFEDWDFEQIPLELVDKISKKYQNPSWALSDNSVR